MTALNNWYIHLNKTQGTKKKYFTNCALISSSAILDIKKTSLCSMQIQTLMQIPSTVITISMYQLGMSIQIN